MNPPSDLRGRRGVVMGLGLFGGGAAAARYLLRRGARVLVTDLRSPGELRESIASLEGWDVEYRVGGHRIEDFRGADLVVANPAVPLDSPYLAAARESAGIVTTECELAAWERPRSVVAVTGTNGKSTTTSLLGAILRTAGLAVWVGGNLGRSLLDDLEEVGPEHRIVLEVSSYQLESLAAPPGWPRTAVVTNLTPDHLDRHGSFEAYAEAKARVLLQQGPGDALVLPASDPILSGWAGRARGRVLSFGPRAGEPGVAVEGERLLWRAGGRECLLLPAGAVPLPGRFNLLNAAAAAAAALDLGVEPPAVAEGIRGFRGLDHRLQFLGVRRGIRIYDNAVSTVPESTISALRSVEPPLLLIAGGRSKNLPLGELAREAASRARAIFLYGAAAEELAREIVAAGGAPPRLAGTLEEALGHAFAQASAGDALLYSPAFASFDQYRNFAERAAEFRRLVGLDADPARA
ncbi:MAG: UDP-N-acetylmuramoyl-L-alanine--D-glutamate ligase [Planctomycetota bacterium]